MVKDYITRGAIIDLDHDEGAYNTQSLIVQNQILRKIY